MTCPSGPMEKRNVATSSRLATEYDDEELRREASLFGGIPKSASAGPDGPSDADEEADEDTLSGHGGRDVV